MYFTNREKTILALLIEYRSGVTVEELQRLLKVSKRTIYREISSVEATIAKLNLQINKPRGEGYRLIGEAFQIDLLRHKLSQPTQANFDMLQRQHAIAITLLLAEEELTMELLAHEFEVSVGTINADLAAIETSFPDYDLMIERRKTRGVIVTGGEKGRRQILSSLIYGNINEYDFYQYLQQLNENKKAVTDNFFLEVIRPETLYLANSVIRKESHDYFASVTDNQLQQLIIILALSLDRIMAGHVMDVPVLAKEILVDVVRLSHQILGYIEAQIKQSINMNERHYFARQLEGLNYKAPQHIFIETFDAEMSYKIKEMIRLTTDQTGFDFRQDETLYEDLMSHVAAAMKRPASLIQKIDNPLLNQIIEEYYVLYDVMKQVTNQLFSEKLFSKEELAYIVIHFASSLERNPSSRNISALVLCSSGVGTSKILESRIRKYLPEINYIDVSKISQMDQIHFESYDVILSTIFLPGFPHGYRVISPLLLNDEIQDIREYIKQTVTYDVAKQNVQDLAPAIVEDSEKFDDVYQTMKIANNLLKQFTIKSIESSDTLEVTLQEILTSLEGYIVTDAQKVTELVVQRYLEAPIGIPNSSIALFHSTNKWVSLPYFAIYDLDRTFPILAMDKGSIELKRVLLMLAPDPLTYEHQLLLGKISSSIIDSDLNTEIYKTGSKDIIYQLLSSLFVDEFRNLD